MQAARNPQPCTPGSLASCAKAARASRIAQEVEVPATGTAWDKVSALANFHSAAGHTKDVARCARAASSWQYELLQSRHARCAALLGCPEGLCAAHAVQLARGGKPVGVARTTRPRLVRVVMVPPL